MSGILWGAALKGIGDAGSSLADSAMQAVARDEQDRREQSRLDRQDARLASQVARGSGARGIVDFSEGTLGEKSMAAKLGMDLPKYRQWRAAEESGNFGAYETEQISEESPPGEKAKWISPVQQRYLDDKRRMFAEISQMFMQGDVYDESVRGRLALQQVNAIEDSLAERRISQDATRTGAGVAGTATSSTKPKVAEASRTSIPAPRVPPRQHPSEKYRAAKSAQRSDLSGSDAVERPTSSPAEQPPRIPTPPPERISAGLDTRPNPAFAAWQTKYGAAWQEQQGKLAQERQAELDRFEQIRAELYRPYRPGR